ncbi:hypothetical protein BJ742DRAFT_904566 [Cladochytrium replicatum]|nr:hypothetical protein BJ742DRAFT_904566 [Cladochytrium replicatum]
MSGPTPKPPPPAMARVRSQQDLRSPRPHSATATASDLNPTCGDSFIAVLDDAVLSPTSLHDGTFESVSPAPVVEESHATERKARKAHKRMAGVFKMNGSALMVKKSSGASGRNAIDVGGGDGKKQVKTRWWGRWWVFGGAVVLLVAIGVGLGVTYRSLASGSTNVGDAFETSTNPNRGFYAFTEHNVGSKTEVNTSGLLADMLLARVLSGTVSEGDPGAPGVPVSTLLRVYYLTAFRDTTSTTLPSSFTDQVLKKDLDVARKAGMRVMLKFAYSADVPVGMMNLENPNNAKFNSEPSPDVVLGHIAQIGAILKGYVDVVSVVYAGFIGTWGEWYYTDHFGYPQNLDAPNVGLSAESLALRQNLLNQLLASVPYPIYIVMRTAYYKRILVSRSSILDSSTEPSFSGSATPNSVYPLTDVNVAYSNSSAARVGHHNDCFLASWPDEMGSYRSGKAAGTGYDREFLEFDTRYLPWTGESCVVNAPYTDCAKAEEYLAKAHATTLNIDYHSDVINGWKKQGCFERIRASLGYNLRLSSASITAPNTPRTSNSTSIATVPPGGTVTVNLQITNTGYAHPHFRHKLILYFVSGANPGSACTADVTARLTSPLGNVKTTSFMLAFPPARALLNEYGAMVEYSTQSFTVQIPPAGMPEGTYSVYVMIPADEWGSGTDADRIVFGNRVFGPEEGNGKLPKRINYLGLSVKVDPGTADSGAAGSANAVVIRCNPI